MKVIKRILYFSGLFMCLSSIFLFSGWSILTIKFAIVGLLLMGIKDVFPDKTKDELKKDKLYDLLERFLKKETSDGEKY